MLVGTTICPLAFLPGFPVITWDLTAALIFQIADVLVGIAITIFCIVILATLLRGNEYMHEKDDVRPKILRTSFSEANRDVQEIKSRESNENEKSSEEKITYHLDGGQEEPDE